MRTSVQKFWGINMANETVQFERFNKGLWETVEIATCRKGEVVRLAGGTVLLQVLEAELPSYLQPISLDEARNKMLPVASVDYYDKPNIREVSLCVGYHFQVFADGTAFVGAARLGNEAIYTPRLPVWELEEFCSTHIQKYRDYYAEYKSVVDDRYSTVVIPIERWWVDP